MNILSTISILLFSFSPHIYADTIYQWSDPWGQIQYSKTPVPGAMISDLTELPEVQETTEKQKRDAMIRKLNEMRQANMQRSQQETMQNIIKLQTAKEKQHCIQLRNLMSDIQFAQLRQFSIFGSPLLPNYYGHLQYDLSRKIQTKCR